MLQGEGEHDGGQVQCVCATSSPSQADSLEWAVHVAPAFSVLVFFISVVVAIFQIWLSRVVQKTSTATNLWDSYLVRALQFPVFAYPPNFPNKFKYEERKIDGQLVKFERYEWFVSSMLRTSDEILRAFDRSDHRAIIIARNIYYHRAYMKWRWGVENGK